MLFKTSENRLCSFCRLGHRVYLKKEVSIFDGILLLLVTGLMAYAIWQGPDLRSLLIFITLAFGFQVFLRVRYRESLKCPHCGFDPVLYRQNNEKAAQKVTDFMEKRKDSPHFLLKPKPQIQSIRVSKEELKQIQLSRATSADEMLDQVKVEANNLDFNELSP